MLIFQRYTWWFGAMAGLVLLLAVVGQFGVLGPFQGLFTRATGPLESGLTSMVRPVAGILSSIGDVDEMRKQNQELLLENEQLRNENVELQQQLGELNDLREALKVIGEEAEDTYEFASVVSRDDYAFTDVVRIDKGSENGIRAGMVVLSAQGTLVGTVTSVTGNRSSVRLISDSRSAVNAQVLGTAVDGVVTGSPTRTVRLQYAQGTINVGDEVVTSGVGDNFPRGLRIGTVTDVKGTPQDVYLEVSLQPFVRLSTIERVLVNTSFDPNRQALVSP